MGKIRSTNTVEKRERTAASEALSEALNRIRILIMSRAKSSDIMPLTVGKVTLMGGDKKYNVRHYTLSVLRVGPLANELSRGDVVRLLVKIPAPTGLTYYRGIVEGRVVFVSKKRIRLDLPAEFGPLAEQVYLRNWPVYIEYVITIERKQKENTGGGV